MELIKTNKTPQNMLVGGTLIINTNFSFVQNKKFGYVFCPLNNHNTQYIIFTNKIKESIKSKQYDSKTNLYCIVKITNTKFKDNIYEAILDRIIGPVNNISNQIEVLYHYSEKYIINPKKYNKPLCNDIKTIYNAFIQSLVKNPTVNYETFSIDPIGCKDIDDAISYLDNDNFIVHIADPNKLNEISSLNEYYHNNTSLYMADKTYHLLPLELSTNYISLLEKQVRPVISVHFKFINGNPTIDKIIRHNIIVDSNMNYNDADKLIDNEESTIGKLFTISKRLELIYYDQSKILKDTHDMIELFMLVINDKIGEYLTNNCLNKKDLLYRTCINNENDDNKSLVATYNNQPLGHHSLKLKHYVHFSSPIRRTADYITHQLLIECLNNESYTNKYQIQDLNNFNNYINTVKIISNRAKYLYVANVITNGDKYKCKLLAINNNKFRWLIINYDIKFMCDICHTDFLDKYTNFINTLRINEIYDIKLFKLTVGKIQNIKLTFEFN